MNATFKLLTRLFRKRIVRETKRHLATIVHEQGRALRGRSSTLLRRLAEGPGQHAVMGETRWGETVTIPVDLIAAAWGLITGGTGSGKSMAAMAIIEALLAAVETDISFGVLDAKGELFERTIFLIARLMETLPSAAAERLRSRVVIIDFASMEAITSFNLAAPWADADLDYFATSRTETLQELFAGDGISLRGGSCLKHTIKLLAEQHVPFSYVDQVLSSETFRSRLIAGSMDEEIREYFRTLFAHESRSTIGAVRARLNATLFSSASLRVSLSGTTAPDFRALMDTGAIVLVNCAGANIPRATARILQSLVLSDIRHAVFNRQKRNPFVWAFDEAQHCFRTKYLQQNMEDFLTMARSYGMGGILITQNLANAVQSAEILEMIHTNSKWAMVLRGSAKDAGFLHSALPVSGRREKPRSNPYAPTEFYSVSEERNVILQGVAHLPDREGWLWLKSLTAEAIPLRTRTVDIPDGPKFREPVERILRDPTIGRRSARAAHLEDVARRDSVWRTTPVMNPGSDIIGDLTELYRAGDEANP